MGVLDLVLGTKATKNIMGLFLISIAFIGSLVIISPVQSQSCKVTDQATKRLVDCEFPFKFLGETHYGCIDFSGKEQGRKIPADPWCSTKVRGPERKHVTGGRHYGDCNSACPDAEEGLRLHLNPPSASGSSSCSPGSENDKNSGCWKPDGAKGECGKRNTLSNIVGGAKAKIGDYPWMALLGYLPPGFDDIFYVCGGSLINKKYVLTAGHCIDTGNGRPVEVVLGEHVVGTDPDCPIGNRQGKCNPPVIRRKIDQNRDIILHEDYDDKGSPTFKGAGQPYNDIALIRMDEAVTLFQEDPKISAANPICLPWSEDSLAYFLEEGNLAIVAGWGRVVEKDTRANQNRVQKNKVNVKHLQQLKVPIADENEKCNGRPFIIDKSTQICAGGEKGKDSCNGDSGGPLIIRALKSGNSLLPSLSGSSYMSRQS